MNYFIGSHNIKIVLYQISEDGVLLYLTSETFDKALEEYPILFINFYAPWCGHCKNSLNEFVKSGISARTQLPQAKFAVVDISDESALVDLLDIHAYPTFRLCLNGKHSCDYHGNRKSNDFISFIKKKTENQILRIDTVEDLWNHIAACVSVSSSGSIEQNTDTNAESQNSNVESCKHGLILGLFPSMNVATSTETSTSTHYEKVETHVNVEDVSSIDITSTGEDLLQTSTQLVSIPAYEAFVQLAKDSMGVHGGGGYPFVYSASVDVAEYFGLPPTLSALVFYKEDKIETIKPTGVIPLPDNVTPEDMEKILFRYTLPAVLVYSEHTASLLASLSTKPQVLVFLDDTRHSLPPLDSNGEGFDTVDNVDTDNSNGSNGSSDSDRDSPIIH
eukprot:gene9214-19110_t